MDIVIHGTKGGRKIFTPKILSGLLDVNADSPKATAIGQQAYAVRFIDNSTIFSKYKIIRDVRGDKRTGFVAFSLYLPNNKKLSGIDIITLLDKVSEEYCKTYIKDDNLEYVNENWDFLDLISKEYESKLLAISSDDIDKLDSGSLDDSFIYYKNIDELKSYFDDPFHNEFANFRQILFVSEDIMGKPEDTLNALRHSGNNLTGKIDLANKKYKLLFNSQAKGGVLINVKVNRGIRSNNIRRNDDLEIIWSKPYYLTVKKQGKLDEISSEFVTVDNNERSRTVSINEIELKADVKNISVEIKDRKGVTVYGTEIFIKSNYQSERKIAGNTITLKGNELGERWDVWAKKGDNMFTNHRPIDIEKDSNNPIKLIFKERKTVKIVATDEGSENRIDNFKVWVQGKTNLKTTNEIIFEDDEIDKKWNITIEGDHYQRSSSITYCPASGKNPIYFRLKSKQKDHSVTGGVSKHPDGLNSIEKIKPFSQNSKVIGGLIAGVFVVSVGIWLLLMSPTKKEVPINISEIQNYVEGNYLFLDVLNSYKTNLENKISKNDENDKGIFGVFRIGTKQTDSAEYKKWNKTLKSVDSAIAKRNLINEKDFARLVNLYYSEKQKIFKLAIDNLKSKNVDVKNKLGDISEFNLNRIADSINTILKPEAPKEIQTDVQNETTSTSNISENNQKSPDNSRVNSTIPDDKQAPTAKVNPIIKELKGSSITQKKLNEYEANNPNFKASIQLYLDFWEKVKKANSQKEDFDDLLKKVKNDNYLNNSELKKFLSKIREDTDAFKKFNGISGKAKLTTLDQLKKKLE